METWIIIFIIFAIVLCVFAIVCIAIDLVFDISARRRERKAPKEEDKRYTYVPEVMMLVPVNHAATAEPDAESPAEPSGAGKGNIHEPLACAECFEERTDVNKANNVGGSNAGRY